MQLKIQSLFQTTPIDDAAPGSPTAQTSLRERIVVTAATTLGVIVVALIAVLMVLVN